MNFYSLFLFILLLFYFLLYLGLKFNVMSLLHSHKCSHDTVTVMIIQSCAIEGCRESRTMMSYSMFYIY